MTLITSDQLYLGLCGKLILPVVLDLTGVAPAGSNDTKREEQIIWKNNNNNYPRCALHLDSLPQECARVQLKMVIGQIAVAN